MDVFRALKRNPSTGSVTYALAGICLCARFTDYLKYIDSIHPACSSYG